MKIKVIKLRKSNFIIFLLIFGFAFLLISGVNSVSATSTPNIYVSTHGNDNWNGLSPVYNSTTKNGPKATIKNATETVVNNGKIYVEKGSYKEHDITINSNMSIIGEKNQNTIINGTHSGSIFIIIDSNIHMNIINLTLTQGSNYSGGAISNSGTLSITNTTFTQNNATMGGAIYNTGTVIMTQTTLSNNTATESYINNVWTNGIGGAVYNAGVLTIANSTLTGNYAGASGGAIDNEYGTLNITNSTLTKNSAFLEYNYIGTGGAIACYKGTINLSYNRIFGNSNFTGHIINVEFASGSADNNWWGVNGDPSQFISGITVNNWLNLALQCMSSTIKNGGSTNVKAYFIYSNNNTTVNQNIGNVGDATVIFNGTGGTFSSSKVLLQNGLAQTVFTASRMGVNIINATLDDQTVQTNLNVVLPLNIIDITPKNGSVNNPGRVTITVKFNQAIKKGNMSISLTGNGQKINCTETLLNNVLTIKPISTLTTGVYTLILNTGSLNSMNNIPLTKYTSKFTLDNTPPRVSVTSPKNMKTKVSRTTIITVKFTENIRNGAKFNNITIKNVATGEYLLLSKSIIGKKLIIKTSSKSAKSWYIVTIPRAAVKDIAGNNFQAKYSFKFKTRS